ncbi:dienelactone hydrolase family protein [Micromonospora sp. NPDC049679]|uniref:dienelactone hydrolase family protein n=1 Tax=Micromonospora sp. NPDC049679 TaxID=3155920 RepID=UPI0033E453DF
MGEMVSYRSNGGSSEGYLALPATGSGAGSPAVIVIQEWWGLVPHITSVADRFASAGFVALAPDLYRGAHTSEPDEAGKLLMGLAMDQAAQDIAGAASYLVERPEVTGKVGAVGFCAGGSLALWSATLSDQIVATAGFYPVMPWERMRPDWSDYAGKAALIHCSEEDGTSAAEGIQTAKSCIENAGGECVLYDYPGTKHAFFNDDRPEVYDRAASSSAWARTLELFRARLG